MTNNRTSSGTLGVLAQTTLFVMLVTLPSSPNSSEQIKPEEYVVYSRLIEHFHLTGEPLVITGKTSVDYVGIRRHWKAGTGYLVLRHKSAGEWGVLKSVIVWMS